MVAVLGSDPMTWTERQFQKAMRDAGYKNDGQGCWIHEQTGKKFYAWTWEPSIETESWRAWAEAEQTPPPF